MPDIEDRREADELVRATWNARPIQIRLSLVYDLIPVADEKRDAAQMLNRVEVLSYDFTFSGDGWRPTTQGRP